MVLVSANPSSPFLLGKSDGPAKSRIAANTVHSKIFASDLQTLLGFGNGGEASFDGAAQEAYDNRAYPKRWIDAATAQRAANAAGALGKLVAANATDAMGNVSASTAPRWQQLGPSGVTADALVASESTGATAGTIYSGRATAIAVAPNCNPASCTVFIGAAGGGVWKTTNALASTPSWTPANNGIASTAIGSITFDPNDSSGNTVYVGTGEPNGSGDSEAGVGLYKSINGGTSWRLVAGSASVATGRSIGAIAIDPTNANHIFIGTDVARHGSSSVNGGRFTPPGSPLVGLYESNNGGATFVAVLILPQDAVNPSSATGGDFFRGGVSHVELYQASGETQVYASAFDYGVFRRSVILDGDLGFHQIFGSAGGGNIGLSSIYRTEFSLAPNGANLRIYVGDGGVDSPGLRASFWRVDNANVSAGTLFNGSSNTGWTKLSSFVNGTPGFASFNYCTGQCTYDMPVYSPPGSPDIVYIGGGSQYSELFGRSNGRDVQRSEDAGVNFTDMTVDTNGVSLHPDQHAIAATPFDPNTVFIGDDGGIFRLNGSFSDVSSQCSSRGLTGANLVDCQHWLSKVPTTISSLNAGLATLQFQSLSVNVQAPLTDIMGGTQDNGTQVFTGKGPSSWFVTIFGDGGQSGINIANPNIRMHTFFSDVGDVNFRGTDELGWDFMTDPLLASGEAASFYIPLITDPKVAGTWFVGLQHVWRTQDNAGSQAHLDAQCNEFLPLSQFDPNGDCGDWVAIGQDLSSTAFGTDKAPGQFIVATSRAPSDTGTLWAGTRRGRVFVTSNANSAGPAAVIFHRIDTAAQPTRFVSGISIDTSNPNHAFISYSGYNAYAIAAGTAPGHVFEVTYNPATHTATWSGDLAGGDPSSGGLGDQPITGIAVDWNTGNIFVSTDFGVFERKSGSTTWQPAAAGLPPVIVFGLTIDVDARVLYAATHGRGAWRLNLSQ
jgi:hypothetical protein